MDDIDYDAVFVGSGPICILEALYLSKQGKRVLIVDRASKLGGAWSTINLPGDIEVEIGCHIWSISSQAFRFIEQYLGIEIRPLRPQPYIQKKRRKYSYDWKMNVITLRRMIENVKRGKFSNLITDWQKPDYRISILPARYLYPVKGATALKNALESKLNQSNIDLEFSLEIETLINRDTHVQLRTSSEKIIKSSKVYITSVSQVKSLTSNHSSFSPAYHTVNYIHVHLIFSNLHGGRFSYVRIVDNPVIHRISDITSQIAETSQRICIAGIFEEAYNKFPEQKIVDIVVAKMKKLGFIGQETAVLHWQFNTFPTHYVNTDTIKSSVSNFREKIQIMPSEDLIYSIHNRLPDWQATLIPAR